LEVVLARLTERLTERLDEQAQQMARLEAEKTALREQVQTLASELAAGTRVLTSGPIRRADTVRSSRRRLLQLGGAAAAASLAAGVLATERGTAHASPARTDTITFHQTAVGAGNVAIQGDGDDGAVGVRGTSDSASGVEGTGGSGVGVFGQSTSASGVAGLSTSGPGVGAASTSGPGVLASSNTGIGGSFIGGLAPLQLSFPGTPGAPTTGTHAKGEIFLDSNAVLWVCTANGTPGTWVRLTSVANGASGGAATFLSTPIRLLDTRSGASGAAFTPNAKILPGTANTFHLQVAGVSFAGVTIPTSARALVGNCTVVNPVGVGDLAVYPDGLLLPNTAVMHYLPGQIVSNGITIGLGTNGKLAITALGSATDVIIDCQGFIA
jgi:hypothetical protein